MTFDRSTNKGEYGTVEIGDTKVKVLFTDIPDLTREPGITIVPGVGSIYQYFVFVPVEVYEALILVRSDDVFVSSLVRLCVRLAGGVVD